MTPIDHRQPSLMRRTYQADTATLQRCRDDVIAQLRTVDAADDVLERAALVVSELATNAIEHADGQPYHVEVRSDGRVQATIVVVNDAAGGGPPPPGEWGPDHPLAVRGRGLAIVETLAEDVHVRRTASGAISVSAVLPLG